MTDKPMRFALEAARVIAVTKGCALDIQEAAEPLLAVVRAAVMLQDKFSERATINLFQILPAALKAMEVSDE